MIIDITNKETTQSTTLTDAKPAKTSKGKPEIRGKKNLRKHSEYLVEPKISKTTGQDVHYGRQWAVTNIPSDMPHPSQTERLMSPEEIIVYRKEFSVGRSEFFYNHAADGNNNRPRSKGKQMDAFRFIISCKPEELTHCKTDEEQAKFLILMGQSVLQKMSASADINFYYDMVPHLKDGNPHLHIKMSSYTIDGQYYEFYRGKQDHGLIKMFDDVKYELEKKHPTLLRMEHDKRLNQRLQVEVDKVTKVATGNHAEVYNKLHAILNSHLGEHYSHPNISEELKEARFEFRYTKAKSGSKFQDIQIFHKDAGEEFRSFANLPSYDKRVLENFQTYQRFKLDLKISRDVSKIISNAVKLTNATTTTNVEELNKILYQHLGVLLTPVYKKDSNGRKYVGSWSFYSTRDNITFPALKAGVKNPKNLIATPDESQAIHDETQTLINISREIQRAKGTKEYVKKDRKIIPKFRFLQQETLQNFISRLNNAGAYKQTLTSGIASGDSLTSKWTNSRQLDIDPDGTVKVYQENMSSAKAAIQAIVAQGFCEMEFKGVSNAKIQRMMYIQSILHNVEITNYTPSAELKAEAQALLDAERDKLIEANKKMINAQVKLRNPNATTPEKQNLLYLRTNRKLDVDVDERPKFYGLLYGLHKGCVPEDFAHIDKLTMTKEEKTKVIEHFASAEKVNTVELRRILRLLGIDPDEEPMLKEPQKPSQALSPPSTTNDLHTRTSPVTDVISEPEPVINPDYKPVRTEPAKEEATTTKAEPEKVKPPQEGTKPLGKNKI